MIAGITEAQRAALVELSAGLDEATSLEDIACMKLSAIAGRGAAKDFWDLDELLAHGVGAGTLEGMLELYQRKFASEDIGHVVRALAYFGDADAAPLPRGLTQERWEAIRRAMAVRVRGL